MNLSLRETRITAGALKQDTFMCLDLPVPEQIYFSFLN